VGELKRVSLEVDPHLGDHWSSRTRRRSGPGFHFRSKNPGKGEFRPDQRVSASTRRMELALEYRVLTTPLDQVTGFLALQKPESLLDKLKLPPKLGSLPPVPRVSGFPSVGSLQGGHSTKRLLPQYSAFTVGLGDGGRFITLSP